MSEPGFGTSCDIVSRIEAVEWPRVTSQLDDCGHAVVPALLTQTECQSLIGLYEQPHRFRKRVVMDRHAYGRGEYQYFDYPLPTLIADLRSTLYARLAALANGWNHTIGSAVRYPATHADFIECCHAAGQSRATPLLLRYRENDYNRLHQDLYGEHVFPLQATVLLSRPGVDFSGGEFVLTEQRPRMQSRVEVVPLEQGDLVVFAGHHRPGRGTRGFHRVSQRHGVSRVRSGGRYTLGVIFHDAL